jgi:hypothetical protein
MTAPVASGWSGCRVGLTPTGKRRLVTAHTRYGHPLNRERAATVIGRNMHRHRHQEFIRFLNAIGAEVPDGKTIHVILDNYAAHKHPKVRAWLDRHERFKFHFTPTSCSWLNAVEGFFAKLSMVLILVLVGHFS